MENLKQRQKHTYRCNYLNTNALYVPRNVGLLSTYIKGKGGDNVNRNYCKPEITCQSLNKYVLYMPLSILYHVLAFTF